MCKSRKLAFFAASNINGRSWKHIVRHGGFRKDTRLIPASTQLGNELYHAIRSKGLRPNDFEQGHLASFEEVLWGRNDQERKKAASDTFYFTNCVPQHKRLNAGLWRSLEQYVLKTQTIQHQLRVSVVTGPVLSPQDPWYIQRVNGKPVRIPCHFWKVIYYPSGKGLSAVGFMMSHRQLLKDEGTVRFDPPPALLTESAKTEDLFNTFLHDAVYQVRVEFIQEVTNLRFYLQHVHLPYQKKDPASIIYRRIEVPPGRSMALSARNPQLDYTLEGIQL